MTAISLAQGLRELAPKYRVLVCDVWGVIHNGRESFPAAVDSLKRFRERGLVLLLSNAPRPNGPIREQLRELGVPDTAYDDLVTSGDLARTVLAERAGASRFRIHHVGPPRDLPLFDGLPVDRVSQTEAEAIVCTGLFDDTRETPQDYAAYWAQALDRRLPFYCANPDLQVQRGDSLIYCAGALARDYEAKGGKVTYLGKPHAPAYEFVARRLEGLGRAVPKSEWLAVGDGLKTDIKGASDAGFDALLITAGIHEAELSENGRPSLDRIAAALAAGKSRAVAAMHRLLW